MEPLAIEPVVVEVPAIERVVEPEPEPVVEPDHDDIPEVAETIETPVVEEVVEPAPQPEPVKPKRSKSPGPLKNIRMKRLSKLRQRQSCRGSSVCVADCCVHRIR